jgi:hypothetical protein
MCQENDSSILKPQGGILSTDSLQWDILYIMKGNTACAGKKQPNLSRYLFWDIDIRKLDYESRASFILERVFTMGMQEDEWKVNKYYGKERIRQEVIKCKSLDKKTMNYLSIFYEIPKKEFACYKKDVFQKGF